uniref:Uncharacterized protein n=1 Tax=Meloidogyne javanica TaxID=6303 RepID=A0A915LHG8_MELJA
MFIATLLNYLPKKNAIDLFCDSIPSILQSAYVNSSSRTISHKWTILLCDFIQIIQWPPAGLSVNKASQFMNTLLVGLIKLLEELFKVQRASSLHWLFVLIGCVVEDSTITPLSAKFPQLAESADKLMQKCVEVLTLIGRCWSKQWTNSLHSKLSREYGLSGFIFDETIVELSSEWPKNLSGNMPPSAYGDLSGYQTAWKDTNDTTNKNGNPSTSSSLHRHHLLMNHLPGLLETEPLIFSCIYGTDHIRVLNEQENENFDLPTTFSTDLNKKSETCVDGREQMIKLLLFNQLQQCCALRWQLPSLKAGIFTQKLAGSFVSLNYSNKMRRRSQSPFAFIRYKTFKNIEQLNGAVDFIIGSGKKWEMKEKTSCDKCFFYIFNCSFDKCHAKFRKVVSMDGNYAIDVGDSSHSWLAHGFNEDIPIMPGLSSEEKFLMHIPEGKAKHNLFGSCLVYVQSNFYASINFENLGDAGWPSLEKRVRQLRGPIVIGRAQHGIVKWFSVAKGLISFG